MNKKKAHQAPTLFAAIGEKSRLQIIKICFSKPQTVDQLLMKTGLEKSLLSKHLRVLRDCELLISSRQGRQVTYSINQKICHPELKNTLALSCCNIQLKDDEY